MAEQWERRLRLIVEGPGGAIDLSNMRVKFNIHADDYDAPNSADIRVFNISQSTADLIMKVFTKVTLEAGYAENLGVIFSGTLRQFRSGRVQGSTDTYLDLLASDGDLAFQDAFINETAEAGTTPLEWARKIEETMKAKGVTATRTAFKDNMPMGGILPRGKVLFGASKVHMNQVMRTMDGTWSIQQGVLQTCPRNAYLPGQAVVLNGQTGLIGRAEQTVDGIRAQCLINPMIKVGQLVQLDNKAINKTTGAAGNQGGAWGSQIAYNTYTSLQHFARVTDDGLYKVYVIEYEGDTRGLEWYSDLTLLAIDPADNTVIME